MLSLKALIRQVAVPSGDSPVHVRGIRHVIANGSATVLYIGLVAVLVESSLLGPVAAVVIAVFAFEVYTYLINRLWVHTATGAHTRAIPRFIVVGLVALSLNTAIMWCTVDLLQLPYYWALVIATAVVPPTNFFLNYLWVFRA